MIDSREQSFVSAIDRDELIQLTQALVRIDSVIRPDTGGTEKDVVKFIVDWLRREVGVEPLVEEVVPGRENIILSVDSGKPGPCLMIEGHTDVVSEGDRSSWTYDPFGAEIVDGKLYGRGSCDMKAGVAMAMIMAKLFASIKESWVGKLKLGLV